MEQYKTLNQLKRIIQELRHEGFKFSHTCNYDGALIDVYFDYDGQRVHINKQEQTIDYLPSNWHI